MKRVSLLVAVVIGCTMTLSGCAKSPEDIAFEAKVKVADLIYAERDTWDLLGTINVTNCLARTISDAAFMLWSSETSKCNNDIKKVVSVVARLDPQIQAVDSQNDVLFSKTRSQFSVVKGVKLCDQLEWYSPTTKEGCVDKLFEATNLATLEDTISSWYAFRANPTK